MRLKGVIGAVLIVAGAALTACGGGGGGDGSTPSSGSGTNPTATPTAAATPGVLSASPAPLNLTQSGQALTFTALEPNYTGTFAQTNTCAGLATISPASVTGSGNAVFTATAIAPGTCDATIAANGQTVDERVVVTFTTVGTQSGSRT